MGKHTLAERRPLIVTADEAFLDQLLQIAAAGGTNVHVAHDVTAARRHWSSASVVVLDEHLIGETEPLSLPKRSDVVLVGRNLDDGSVWQRAVRAGAEHVVFLPDANQWLVEKMADDAALATADVIAVMGGCGGAGASTFSVALSLHATAAKRDVVLVDADRFGGGIDLLLGSETKSGMRWDGLADARGAIDRDMLMDALPSDQRMSFLSWTPHATGQPTEDAVRSVMKSLTQHGDLVVVDMSSRPDAAFTSILDHATILIVVPARVRAVAATHAIVAEYADLRHRMKLVVRTPAPGGIDPEEIARVLSLPLLGTIGHDPRRAEWEEHGIAPASRAAWSSVCAAALVPETQSRPAA